MRSFSITRFYHLKPTPPLFLGGEFQRIGDRIFLKNALVKIELTGPSALFSALKNGDQALVHVTRKMGESIECDKASCLVSAQAVESVTVARPLSCEFAHFVRSVRDFFVEKGLQEIFTPTLVTCPGLEPYLEPFSVEISKGRERQTVFLPTSPEIHLKMALAQGWSDIFEIKSCFRKGEFSKHHENEFTMLEWYRGFADLEMIVADLEAFIQAMAPGTPKLQITTFSQLFKDLLGFNLHPATSGDELRELCSQKGVHHAWDDSFNDLFHRLTIDCIEPRLKDMGPVLIRDFPPSQAALARLTDKGWADRFEFYWQGLEIANAFNEVNDPEEQLKRWQMEQDERLHLGTSEVPQDPALIEALRAGMPPAGGIAVGLERLFMAIHGIDEIRELKLFSSDDLFR